MVFIGEDPLLAEIRALRREVAELLAELAAVREMVATRTPPPPPDNYPLSGSMWQCAGCGTWTPLGQFHTCQTVVPRKSVPGRVWCSADVQP